MGITGGIVDWFYLGSIDPTPGFVEIEFEEFNIRMSNFPGFMHLLKLCPTYPHPEKQGVIPGD